MTFLPFVCIHQCSNLILFHIEQFPDKKFVVFLKIYVILHFMFC